MNRETAERLAAAHVENVTFDQARRIIHWFLLHASRCPVCDGTGTFTFMHDTAVPVDDGHGKPLTVKAGIVSSCPRCGGVGETLGRDLKHVAWHCVSEDATRYCRRDMADERTAAAHAGCGWRLVLSVETEQLQPEGREA